MGIIWRTAGDWRTGVQITLRAAIALVMILSLFLAQFGYPVWKVVAKNGDRPFPCQFSNCGCHTAEQCRTSCCCHSKRERVAWAVDRGIDPDQVAVLTPAEKFEFTFEEPKTKTCCQAKKPSCCSQKKEASCCESTVEESSEAQLQWVLAIAAHKCRGTGVEWIQAGMVAPPPLPITFEVELPIVRALNHPLPSLFSVAQEPLLRPV
jgi:hypothetical protein